MFRSQKHEEYFKLCKAYHLLGISAHFTDLQLVPHARCMLCQSRSAWQYLEHERHIEPQLHVGGVQVHRAQQRPPRLRHLVCVVEGARQQQRHSADVFRKYFRSTDENICMRTWE